MKSRSLVRRCRLLMAGLAVSLTLLSDAAAHAEQGAAASPKDTSFASGNPARATSALTSSGNRNAYLRHTWGINDLEIRSTSSGELLRFSYRVVDASRAAALNDVKSEPHLIDESSGYMLQIPTLEKVGQLRQTAKPLDGRQYWMVFSNKGGLVKPGSRVAIVIGQFRVNGLIVDQSAGKSLQ